MRERRGWSRAIRRRRGQSYLYFSLHYAAVFPSLGDTVVACGGLLVCASFCLARDGVVHRYSECGGGL